MLWKLVLVDQEIKKSEAERSIIKEVTPLQKRLRAIDQGLNYHYLRKDEEHEAENDISDDYRIASNFEIIFERCHSNYYDNRNCNYPK